MMSFQLRKASPADLEEILSIARSWPSHFTPQGLEAIAADFTRSSAMVALEGGCTAGFILWTGSLDTVEILWIAVHPRHVRRGIGTALVEEVIRRSPDAGEAIVKTATEDSEIPGTDLDGASFRGTHEFYRKLGFEPVEVLKAYWAPNNHALVLSRSLTKD
jgi:ribosomal protein S18 acetylase RimI-like enzyme